MAKTKRKNSEKNPEQIVIDESQGLVFNNEDELFEHFAEEIHALEEEFFELRSDKDVLETDFGKYDKNLGFLLDDPDQIWEDDSFLEGKKLTYYIREFNELEEDEPVFHIAVVYLTNDIPSFVYLHFPTKDQELLKHYQKGKLIFDQNMKDAPLGSIEGDALSEEDELAVGLYESMLKLRSAKDIPEDKFRNYAYLREESIEDADEIWRKNDTMGNILVYFIKEYSDEEKDDLFYIVATVEDTPSNSHALLFSFPTNDKNLVGRFRLGENLQADEVVQESSH